MTDNSLMTATQNFSICSVTAKYLAKSVLGLALMTALLVASDTARLGALDVTWTQTLQDEVKVLAERFTGHPHDHPDMIASNCPGKSKEADCARHR